MCEYGYAAVAASRQAEAETGARRNRLLFALYRRLAAPRLAGAVVPRSPLVRPFPNITEDPAVTKRIPAAIVAKMLRISHILRVNHAGLVLLCERCCW